MPTVPFLGGSLALITSIVSRALVTRESTVTSETNLIFAWNPTHAQETLNHLKLYRIAKLSMQVYVRLSHKKPRNT
ncbi:hypothetical protein F4775DRAFT_530880 [Biscogniauxia sp. FL1348]|nr:hypothetical protein F4775DRAFT_530880 [Biscogniauxia sp. FL1348]